MRGEHPLSVVLLAPDLAAAKDFYAHKIGLEIISENDDAVTFRCGGTTRLVVSATTTSTADERTQAAWQVEDLTAELDQLRGDRRIRHPITSLVAYMDH